MNKWEDYITEVKPELFTKLNEYVCIDNIGESKNTKAFRLRKNGANTNVFQKMNIGNVPQINNDPQENLNLDNNMGINVQNNPQNVIHINFQQRNNEIVDGNNNNSLDFE